MTDIKSMNMEELKELMVQIGEKPFRAKQIYGWLHEHLVTSIFIDLISVIIISF